MNTNFIFVHGTGVRQPAYDKTLAKIQQNLNDFTVYKCYWGDQCGSKLNEGGKSIPTFETNRSIDQDLTEEEFESGLWNLLYQDPLFEIGIISIREQEQENDNIPKLEIPGEKLHETIQNFTPSEDLSNKLVEAGITPAIFKKAKNRILESDTYSNIIPEAQSYVEDYRDAIAKALIAQSAILVCEEYGVQALWLTGKMRDQLVEGILKETGGTDRGISDIDLPKLLKEKFTTLLKSAGNAALSPITFMVHRKRGSLSEAAAATVGDVIMYQARGQGIRNFIRKRIEEVKSEDPTSKLVLLAHSLGGIACVDLLLESSPPQVCLLVTIGSQVPLLYEWNALVNKEYKKGARLATFPFPQWLNIYDEKDFLSYKGSAIFPGEVQDISVSNGQPFPASHGAYWNNPDVWTAILDKIKEI